MPDNPPDRDEQAEDPAATHGRTLAQLVEEQTRRQRDQTAWAFGFDPNQESQDDEETE